MSADTARLFFALWPPAELAEQLAGLARQIGGGRATRAETIHLTLAFLGNLPVDRIEPLKQLAAGVRAAAFALPVDRLGYWAHNRLLWAGCAEQPALPALVDALCAALESSGFAVDGAHRPFFPHLTLARKLAEKPALPELPAFTPWPCSRFVLVRSKTSAAGPAYDILGEYALHP